MVVILFFFKHFLWKVRLVAIQHLVQVYLVVGRKKQKSSERAQTNHKSLKRRRLLLRGAPWSVLDFLLLFLFKREQNNSIAVFDSCTKAGGNPTYQLFSKQRKLALSQSMIDKNLKSEPTFFSPLIVISSPSCKVQNSILPRFYQRGFSSDEPWPFFQRTIVYRMF